MRRPLPRITLVTLSFNQGRYLEQAMRSVLDQGYPDLEYIVMDGGSTDGSVEIIRKYAGRLAHWESGKDAGPSDAIQRGFSRATGEVMGFVNSDDILFPGSLHAVGSWFAAHPAKDVVVGASLDIDAEGSVTRSGKGWPIYRLGCRDTFERMLARGCASFAAMSCFWRREAYLAVGGWDTTVHFADDLDLFLRLARRGPFGHLPRFLSCFRLHSASKTCTLRERFQEETREIQEKYGWRFPLSPRQRVMGWWFARQERLRDRWVHLLLRLGLFRVPAVPRWGGKG